MTGVDRVVTKPAKTRVLVRALIALTQNGKPARWPRSGAEAPALLGLRVLLAEDHLVNQMLAARLLQGMGARVQVTGDGLEALSALREADFDVVLMDCQMPQMDGYEPLGIAQPGWAGEKSEDPRHRFDRSCAGRRSGEMPGRGDERLFDQTDQSCAVAEVLAKLAFSSASVSSAARLKARCVRRKGRSCSRSPRSWLGPAAMQSSQASWCSSSWNLPRTHWRDLPTRSAVPESRPRAAPRAQLERRRSHDFGASDRRRRRRVGGAAGTAAAHEILRSLREVTARTMAEWERTAWCVGENTK